MYITSPLLTLGVEELIRLLPDHEIWALEIHCTFLARTSEFAGVTNEDLNIGLDVIVTVVRKLFIIFQFSTMFEDFRPRMSKKKY